MSGRPDAFGRLRAADTALRRLPAVLADALGRLERAARDDTRGELAALAEADGLVLLARGRPALLLLVDGSPSGYVLTALPLAASAAADLGGAGSASVSSRGDRVLAFVCSRSEPTTAAHVAGGVAGLGVDQARVYLSRLCRAGLIERVRRGEYVPSPSERNRRNSGSVSSVSSQVNAPADQRKDSAGQRTVLARPRPAAVRRPAATAAFGEPGWPRIAEDLRGELDEDGTPTSWPFIVHSRAALTCETPGCGRPVRRRAYRGAPVHCAGCWAVAASTALRQAEAEAPGVQGEAQSSGVDGSAAAMFDPAGLDDGKVWV